MRAYLIIMLCISLLDLRGQRIAKVVFPSAAGFTVQEGIVMHYILDDQVAGFAGLEDSIRMFVGFLDPVFSSFSTSVHTDGTERIKVFPNPFSEIIFLRSALPGETIGYKLADLHGRTVLQGRVSDADTSIQTRHLFSGVYILTLSHAAGHFTLYKLIKL